MADADRPVALADIAEADGRTIGVGLRPLAAEFVQAPALAMAEIAVFQGKAAGVEMRAPLAVFVDQPAVGEFRPVLDIQSPAACRRSADRARWTESCRDWVGSREY
jgi:hypothetical protein